MRSVLGPSFSSGSRRDAPAAKHVVGGEHRLLVEKDFREGIESVEDEIHVLMS